MSELITIDANSLPVIEWRGVRVVTTETLAAGYGVDEANIRMNLSNNRDRFVEGVHIITLKSDALRLFRNQVKDIYSVNKHTTSLTLWTEKGAARMSKIVDSDEAWSFFEKMEDAYFRPIQVVQADPTAMGLPNFLDPVSSALAWAEAKKESDLLTIELKEAKRTKSQISRSREASALGKLSAVTRQNRQLSERLGESVKHATITAVQNVTGIKHNPYPMRKWCKERALEVETVPDPRFGSVKSWPAEAWLEVHGVDLKKLFGSK
ncbi:ORF6N domain-containing protein [Providencia stuartii]|uniref:ORF6N domain-containing protein n=1 Tax=Providencia stuartii TaxID=588 RepID=UPI000909C4CE|nr:MULTISPECIES: ORF6N domain-containing protein [Providencia]APG53093.1 antirepressor [Providencia stuartii]MBG5903772.1 ORF6N domain-containing protein [Providencia stuartii]MBG5934649.1 ORF6N domain-containing protein [Providencia stuartii]MDE8747121.1 ORF6N domain-containing protein [Providencia thailandensis]MDE8765660.1 ORF6N domain-containing protein [Providencia thailandensis]